MCPLPLATFAPAGIFIFNNRGSSRLLDGKTYWRTRDLLHMIPEASSSTAGTVATDATTSFFRLRKSRREKYKSDFSETAARRLQRFVWCSLVSPRARPRTRRRAKRRWNRPRRLWSALMFPQKTCAIIFAFSAGQVGSARTSRRRSNFNC